VAPGDRVPAPPKTRNIDSNINSTTNKNPPEQPTSWPTRQLKITIVTILRGLMRDPVVLKVTSARLTSIDSKDMLRPKLILHKNTVNRLRLKWGELTEKLPVATSIPIRSLRPLDSSPRSMLWFPLSTNNDPRPAAARNADLCSL
jgi:hypothetical protein